MPKRTTLETLNEDNHSVKKRKTSEDMDSQETVDYSMYNEDSVSTQERADSIASVETVGAETIIPDPSTLRPSSPPALTNAPSVNRDAGVIAEMLNIADPKDIASEIGKIRANPNRMEIVTNQILENNLPINNHKATNDLNDDDTVKPGTSSKMLERSKQGGQATEPSTSSKSAQRSKHGDQVTGPSTSSNHMEKKNKDEEMELSGTEYSEEDIDMIFLKMCKAYKDIKRKDGAFQCDLNELFTLVEGHSHEQRCVDRVVQQMMRRSTEMKPSSPGKELNAQQTLHVKNGKLDRGEKASTTTQHNNSKDHATKAEQQYNATSSKPTEKTTVTPQKEVTTPAATTTTKENVVVVTLPTPNTTRDPPSTTKTSPVTVKAPPIAAVSPVKLKSVMSDARTLMTSFPQADPNKIFNMLEALKTNPDRVKLVEMELTSSQNEATVKNPVVEEKNPVAEALQNEAQMLSIVFPHLDGMEILAYLEAHHDKPNRMEIVSEELLTKNNDSQGNSLDQEMAPLGARRGQGDASTSTTTAITTANTTARDLLNFDLSSVIDPEQIGTLASLQHDVDLIRVVFPDSDPVYIQEELQKIEHAENRVEILSTMMSERNSYPRLKERMDKLMKERRQKKILAMQFNLEEFLALYPDPKKEFYNEEKMVNDVYKEHLRTYLRNTFPNLVTGFLHKVIEEHKHHLTPCLKALKKVPPVRPMVEFRRPGQGKEKRYRGEPRNYVDMPSEPDEYFYTELMYTEHEEEITDFLEATAAQKKLRFEQAKKARVLETCGCCYDDEVVPEDMLACPSGHRFCKECIRRGAESAIGQDKTTLECMSGDCPTPIATTTLIELLPPKTMALLLRKIQEEEIRAAGIEGLESCPFCSFACIMIDSSSKVFQCHNPECKRESCRQCKEPSHMPLRCDEVEKSSEVNKRAYIEYQMSMAMIRTCPKCNKRFYKTEGCNMMTCTCGQHMCYVCRKPIAGYDHFQANQECNETNAQTIHLKEMRKAAEEAKAKYDAEHPEMAGTSLKHDPLQLLQQAQEDGSEDYE